MMKEPDSAGTVKWLQRKKIKMVNSVSEMEKDIHSKALEGALQKDYLITDNINPVEGENNRDVLLQNNDQSSADVSHAPSTEENTKETKCEDSDDIQVNNDGNMEKKMLKQYSRRLKKNALNVGTMACPSMPMAQDSTEESTLTLSSITEVGSSERFSDEKIFGEGSFVLVAEENVKIVPGVGEPVRSVSTLHKKKLLILDLNGLLADIVMDLRRAHRAEKRINGKSIFKRPFCDEFLKFCFETFHVGVWSSRRGYNVKAVVDYLMEDTKHKLLFCWDESKCTGTGYRTLENRHKPLVLKELKKLWNKEETDLPWEKGDYSPSNTLLIDDSPYKALLNPLHTAIFPESYHYEDENDNSLGTGGDLCMYLKGLATCNDVQEYVREHPFGQRAIDNSHKSWDFYRMVIDGVGRSLAPAT